MDHFFEQVVDSLSDAFITVDQDQNIVVYNKMAELIFGYTKQEIQDLGLDAIIPESYRQMHRESYAFFVANIERYKSYTSDIKQLEGLRKGGEIFPIELTHSMVKFDNTKHFITAIIRDITLRKRYELMRNRIERITRHDLKNKLIIVSLAAKRLATAFSHNDKAKVEKYIEIVQGESEGLITLLDSTRELLLLETGEYIRKDETLDLPTLVNSKIEQMKPFAACKEVHIVFDNRIGAVSSLHADRSLLERALENLLKNAVEAEERFQTVRVILAKDDRHAPVLEIHNGGSSIPEAIQKDLFSPYVTHGKKGGVGLGLYATKLILETIHGWELTFRSSPQETIFKITFPLPTQ